MKANKQAIIDAIIKLIEQGKATEKICAAICSKFQFTERTFYNHYKIAQEQHTTKQQALKDKLAKVDEAAAIEACKKAIMTADQRKEYLTKLILGEIEVPYTEVKWDKNQNKFVTIKFVELASHTARVSAIAELNKMEGDYAPTKIASTDKEGNDVKPLNDAELDKMLSKIEQLLPK